VREFAGKIASSAAPSRSISLSLKNLSSISAAEAGLIEQQLREDLAARGFRIVGADPAETSVDVSLSENVDGFLWVATIRNAAASKVVILKPIGGKNPDENAARVAPVLRRSVLLRQREPILDFAQTLAPSGGALLLLEQEQVTILQRSGNEWLASGSAPVRHSQPWPRDLRGHIISSGDGFQAYLPGLRCAVALIPSLTTNCEDSGSATWSDGNLNESFVTGRNYLSLSMANVNGPGIELPSSYSIAFSGSAADSFHLMMTGIDGVQRTLVQQPVVQQSLVRQSLANGTIVALPPVRWGDDIASIAPDCGTDWDIVASASGDWTQKDRLQVYEVAGMNAVPLGDAIEFPGPITALWSFEQGKLLRVVSRNLETGMYEASIVSISCGN
jgi:hypothetical protein